jgi:hypothetical protein
MASIITQGSIFFPFRQYVGNWAEAIRERREKKAQEQGGISHPVSRRSMIEWFNELINCAQCTGFWCGLFCGFLLYQPEITWGDLKLLSEYFFATFIPLYFANEYIWQIVYRLFSWIFVWVCCGLGGSFLSALGCNAIEWVFYRKMNALRQLEEQDIALAERKRQESEERSQESGVRS